jgi:hypothetical protein
MPRSYALGSSELFRQHLTISSGIPRMLEIRQFQVSLGVWAVRSSLSLPRSPTEQFTDAKPNPRGQENDACDPADDGRLTALVAGRRFISSLYEWPFVCVRTGSRKADFGGQMTLEWQILLLASIGIALRLAGTGVCEAPAPALLTANAGEPERAANTCAFPRPSIFPRRMDHFQ